MKKLKRRLLLSNISLTIGIVAYAVFFQLFWRQGFGTSAVSKIGMVLLFLGLGLSGLVGWLKSKPWVQLPATKSTNGFILQALANFRFIRQSFQVLVPLYLVLFGLGINLMLYDTLQEATLVARVLAHVGVTSLLVLVGGLSIYYQKLKYQEIYQPVVEELEGILQELERE